jgi:hypothetical protein
MVSPATISQVADLKLKVLVELLATLVGSLFLNLLLHSFGIEHLFVEIEVGNVAIELSFARCHVSFGTLRLFELLSVKEEFIHSNLVLLDIGDVEFIFLRNLDSCLNEIFLLLS